jgi:uncharacterized membrane protein
MLFASISKICDMIAVKTNPDLFDKTSIQYHYRSNQFLAYLHIILGMFFLCTGAYQLIPFFRNKYRHFHRIVGRLFLTTSLLVSLSGIVMAVYHPFGNILETITTLIFGVYLLVGTYYAYTNAKNRNISEHRKWVLRVYFVSLSIATIRIVAAIGMGFTGKNLSEMLGISFVIAFLLHFIIVEIWIRLMHPDLKKTNVNQ